MKKGRDNSIRYSPTDLTRFFESHFSSWMDHYEQFFDQTGPLGKFHRNPPDDLLSLLKDKGIEHEARVIDQKSKNSKIVRVEGQTEPEKVENTIAAMKSGADLIYQAALKSSEFFGYADILEKRSGKSKLGDHYYVPADVKIASHPKPTAILQLLAYAEMLYLVQERLPDEISVITKDGKSHSYSAHSLFHYYQYFKSTFLKFHGSFDPKIQPIPEKTKEHRDWSIYAKRVLHEKDDLALTAKLRSTHAEILRNINVNTLTQLSEMKETEIKGIPDDTLSMLKRQARLQVQSKERRPPLFEVFPHEGRMGLAMLPPPSEYDVFFDMEGYPLLGENGLEYLYGYAFRNREYNTIWAYNPSEEAHAFKSFISYAHDRWREHPDMKIYHYGHYEPSTVKRLMGQHGICERMVDDLLRSEVFVDLYQIVKQALLVGTYSYGLKSIEALYYPERDTDVSSGAESAVEFARWLDVGGDPASSEFLKRIKDYNKDDCLSTLDLETFLRKLKDERKIQYIPFQDPTEETKSEDPESLKAQCSALASQMMSSILEEKRGLPFSEATTEDFVCEQLAHSLDFVRREENPEWWDYFSKQDLSQEDLRDDPDAIVNVKIIKPDGADFLCSFDLNQDTKFHKGSSVRVLENHSPHENLSIKQIDYVKGQIVLGGKFATRPTGTFTLAPGKVFFNKDMILRALLKHAQNFDRKKPQFGLRKCVHDLLTKSRPEVGGILAGKPLVDGDVGIVELTDLVLRMKDSVLCIQGPPGTGKTYTGSRIIAGLLKAGKKIAVSSNSHNAMNHLIAEVAKLSPNSKIAKVSSAAQAKEDKDVFSKTHIEVKATNTEPQALSKFNLISGTVFYLAKLENVVDYLFIDEATQVALPNLLAMAGCTKSIVLLGDQMQLDQPIKGHHPGESGNSALVHLTNGRPTVPPDFGIFLDKTFRMHPDLCKFVSDQFYEGRLTSVPDTEKQMITWTKYKQRGLQFIPVNHVGNTHASIEEIEIIRAIVEEALKHDWINKSGKPERITLNQILIVAPYNHQVALLKDALPEDARIGTVDIFQGQEAPLVITSMCSSTLEDAPRGAQFLLNANRINVAISRAKALSLVVGSPALAVGQTSSIDSMKLISTYCNLVMNYAK